MSDYDYDDQYQYEEPEIMQEQSIETTLEFENFQAEELVRGGKMGQALQAFISIYEKANQHNARSWKAKSLLKLLELYTSEGRSSDIKKTLSSIMELNKNDKLCEQDIKNIIKTLSEVKNQSFQKDIITLIQTIQDGNGRLKCYFQMLKKEIKAGNLEKTQQLYKKIKDQLSRVKELSPSLELQSTYLELELIRLRIKKGKVANDRNSELECKNKLASFYIKLHIFEQDPDVNEDYLSKIKQEIAEILYREENYAQCANLLCSCFIEKSKFGKNPIQSKQLLKINVLTIFLCSRLQLFEDSEFNTMLQENASAFKADQDVMALFGLITAFKNLDINEFQQIMKTVKFTVGANSPYADLQKKVVKEMKKQKIIQICKSYRTIKFEYLSSRIKVGDEETIKSMLFELITSNKINGVIHLKDKYLEVLPEKNKYYSVQLQNLHDLTKRM